MNDNDEEKLKLDLHLACGARIAYNLLQDRAKTPGTLSAFEQAFLDRENQRRLTLEAQTPEEPMLFGKTLRPIRGAEECELNYTTGWIAEYDAFSICIHYLEGSKSWTYHCQLPRGIRSAFPSRQILQSELEERLARVRAAIPLSGTPCAVCNGTGVDENLHPEALSQAVAQVLERSRELEAEEEAEAERARFAIEQTYERLSWMFRHGQPMNEHETRWYNRESVRRVKERNPTHPEKKDS